MADRSNFAPVKTDFQSVARAYIPLVVRLDYLSSFLDSAG